MDWFWQETARTGVGSDNRGEIVLYQPEGEVRLEVRVENETVWLNRQQLAMLFNRDIKTIGKHITNALKEECQNSVVAKFATTILLREKFTNLEFCDVNGAIDYKLFQVADLICTLELGCRGLSVHSNL